jgi:hypothetical protein
MNNDWSDKEERINEKESLLLSSADELANLAY